MYLPYLLHKRGVDLLHMPWFYAPAVVPSRLVITVHDLTDVLTPPPGISSTLQAGRLFFARRALARADRIIAVSHSSKRDLSRVFDVPEHKIDVVYNALDERFVREPMPEGADRILERHAVTDPFVLYAGNIKPQKNLPRLIEAFAVAKGDLRDHPKYANLKLLLIGDSAEEHSDLRRAVFWASCLIRCCACFIPARARFFFLLCTKDSACRRLKPWPTALRSSLPACLPCRKFFRKPRCWQILKIFLKSREESGKSSRKMCCAKHWCAADTNWCRNIPGTDPPNRCGVSTTPWLRPPLRTFPENILMLGAVGSSKPGGGSPRFGITLAGISGTIFVYIGPPPNYTGCAAGWTNSGELLTAASLVNRSQLPGGAFYDP
jgi:hypothetical protein